MRIVSYNIHKGVGNDRRYRLDRIVEVIAREAPDFVCLQEVDFNVRRSRYDDQPELLARELGLDSEHFQLNVPRRQGGYGNLVLSRWPLQSRRDVCLRYRRRKPRAAQVGIVDAPGGAVRIVNWHLGLLERERRWQAERLIESNGDGSTESLPTVVVGDSNDWRNTLHDRFAEAGFEQVSNPVEDFRSFPSFLPVISLDKAFVRGISARGRIVRSKLARRASDHLPLVVELGEPGSEAVSTLRTTNAGPSENG